MNGSQALRSPAGSPLAASEGEQKQEALIDQIRGGLKQITPTLLLVTIATGFAFAIGSGLGHAVTQRYLTPRGNGRARRK